MGLRHYFSFILLLLLIACQKEEIVPVTPIPTPVTDSIPTAVYDVSYGADEKQSYDYHLPIDFNPATPLLILVHGGGWEGGDKSEIRNYQLLVNAQLPAYAVLNINYRLCEVGMPIIEDQVADVRAAIAHFESQQPQWQGQKIGLGYSAGGHLLAEIALRGNLAQLEGTVLIAGHVDFTVPAYQTTPLTNNYLQNVFGTVTYAQNPTLWEQQSPISHVTTSAPAFQLFYFGMDGLVPALQGQRLHDRLQMRGVSSSLTIYPNDDHFGWTEETRLDMETKLCSFLSSFL